MKIFASIQDMLWRFDQVETNGQTYLKEKNVKIEYDFTPIGNNRYTFILNNTSHLVHIVKENGTYHVHLDGDYFPVQVEDERMRDLRALVEQASQAGGEHTLVAPIPGIITKLMVKEGDKVQNGDGLIILEAMKMENEIKAEQSGTIRKIFITEGTPVEKDQNLILIG